MKYYNIRKLEIYRTSKVHFKIKKQNKTLITECFLFTFK